jgi:GDP/UDP-N,N'-diacetylbacillosamine 2-epimerase (hydrolysing)
VKTLLFVLGSRGEWGYIKPIIEKSLDFGFHSEICAVNMLLLPRHGNLIEEIESAGFRVTSKILSAVSGDTHGAMAKSIGVVTQSFTDVLLSRQPDWVILAGDRAEQLGAAIASTFMYIPTAHIQAGERSGNIDGVTRHAITKLVHLHFASNADAAERVLKMGEESFRVITSGAPQIDSLINDSRPTREELIRKNLILNKPYILVCFHPVTEDYQNISGQITVLLDELKKSPLQKIWILPNNDAGGEKIREIVLRDKEFSDRVYSNLSRELYVALMEHCEFLVGNSSSGILEAPSLGIPVVNIGRRQADRLSAENVIHCEIGADEISKALVFASSLEAKDKAKNVVNPYGDGNASAIILKTLQETNTSMEFLIKSIAY